MQSATDKIKYLWLIAALLMLWAFSVKTTFAAVAGYSISDSQQCTPVQDNARFDTLANCNASLAHLGTHHLTRAFIGSEILTNASVYRGSDDWYPFTRVPYTAYFDLRSNPQFSSQTVCYVQNTSVVMGNTQYPNSQSGDDNVILNLRTGYASTGYVFYPDYASCMVGQFGATASNYTLTQNGDVVRNSNTGVPSLPNSPPNQECTISNLAGCLSVLFFPSTAQLQKFSELSGLVSSKPPFGWFAPITNMFGSINGVQTTQSIVFIPALQNLQTALSLLIYIFFGISLFKRIQKLQI